MGRALRPSDLGALDRGREFCPGLLEHTRDVDGLSSNTAPVPGGRCCGKVYTARYHPRQGVGRAGLQVRTGLPASRPKCSGENCPHQAAYFRVPTSQTAELGLRC